MSPLPTLVPRDRVFFDLFNQAGQNTVRAARDKHARFAGAAGRDVRWSFVVGRKPAIDALSVAVGLAYRSLPAGDTGFWQGAIREPDDPFREGLRDAFLAGEMLTVDLLYGDHEGGQLTVSRFILTREQDGHWRAGVVRHWMLQGADPRGR